MKLSITHQEKYSRGELILRTLFGYFYIVIPHEFLLGIVGIWSGILSFVTFWIVLFTGRFPESIFNFQIGYQNWSLRVNASISNLVDGYPAFFPKGTSDTVKLEVPRPEKVSQGMVLVRALFGGIYVGIPHGICLYRPAHRHGRALVPRLVGGALHRPVPRALARVQRRHVPVDAPASGCTWGTSPTPTRRSAARSDLNGRPGAGGVRRRAAAAGGHQPAREGRRDGVVPHDVRLVGGRAAPAPGQPHRLGRLLRGQPEGARSSSPSTPCSPC